MKIVLLRHGKTIGNEKKRYIGRTDEPLSDKGKLELSDTQKKLLGILRTKLNVDSLPQKGKQSGKNATIYMVCSPMLRCRETEKRVFSGLISQETQKDFIQDDAKSLNIFWNIEEDLRECDFGIFENKNYLELSMEPRYQQWIDSNGTTDFPEGESLEAFKKRSVAAFRKHIKNAEDKNADLTVFTIHGGSIMAIMEALDSQKLGYYQYSVKNGEFVFCELREDGCIYTFSVPVQSY